MTITITSCSLESRRACEELIRDAFWDLYRPGCVEHLIAHQAWPTASVALQASTADGTIVGCLIGTTAHVVRADGSQPVLYLGPLAVIGPWQGRGVGSALMRQGLDEATELGFDAAFLFGDPDYYRRFGFEPAERLAVTTADGYSFDAFQARLLGRPSWPSGSGRLIEGEAFDIEPGRLSAFDAQFPAREAHVLPGQFGQ